MAYKFWTSIGFWANAGLSFFYPECCQYCGNERAAAAEGFICANCSKQVTWIQPPFCERCGLPFEGAVTTAFECTNCKEIQLHFERARSAVAAKGLVLELIHRYKYQRALWFEPFLAGLLVRAAVPVLQQEHWDVIVPVPLHVLKRSEREFNQAERLALHLSKSSHIPLGQHLLKRTAPTRTQTRLSRAARTANVHSAFTWIGPEELPGQSVVLVDDVLTTGATTSACAKVLLTAGARRVCVWTVARGLLN